MLQKKTEYGINSVNPLYLMISRITSHFEEKDGDKCLIISPKKINDYSQPIKYDDNYMKIKLNTDDNIPLNKIIYLLDIAITIRSVIKR